MLEENDEQTRLENVELLIENIARYEEEYGATTLDDFLSYISLYTDNDEYNNSEDYVVLMTLHGAKGLEFDNVFMPAMEEGIFPTERSRSNIEDIEEEGRLCYVGITRARKNLYASYANRRMLFGKTMSNYKSRFLDEFPEDNLTFIEEAKYNLNFSHNDYIFSSPKPKPYNKGMNRFTFDIQNPIDYIIGDKVEHFRFGKGVVTKVTKLSGDSLIEVDFELLGIKKLMANYTNMTKE
jgi:DNA helicase-2/ATP-dependent DNA helicase PcrA